MFSILFQRYYYYITEGIPGASILEQDEQILKRVVTLRLSAELKSVHGSIKIIEELKSEILEDYNFSLRKAIGKDFCILRKHFNREPVNQLAS